MACYFGCNTGANKCAYFWYFALVLGGIGCLVGWYFKSDGCIAQTEQCLVANDVTSEGLLAGFDIKEVWDSFMGGLDGDAVCSAAFPEASEPQLEGCETCYNEVSPCFETTIGVFIAGIVLVASSFLMILFCCFCSSAPQNRYYA